MSECKTKLITTTVDFVTDTNIFYKSWYDKYSQENLCDIVTRSFAAPLYFGQIVDYDNQKVYSDGGVGNANLPINEAKIQAEAFGWYSDGEEVEIDAIGSLYDGSHLSFKRVARGRWLKQLIEFMNPKNGGLARVQSREDQIRRMKFICEHVPTIKFKYWDMSVRSKYVGMDKLKYLDKYINWGKEMAESPLFSYNIVEED